MWSSAGPQCSCETLSRNNVFPVLVFFQSAWHKGFAELFQLTDGGEVFLSCRAAAIDFEGVEEVAVEPESHTVIHRVRHGGTGNFPQLATDMVLRDLSMTPRASCCPLGRSLREELDLDELRDEQQTYTHHGGGAGLGAPENANSGAAPEMPARVSRSNSNAFLLPVDKLPLLLDVKVSGMTDPSLFYTSHSMEVKAGAPQQRPSSSPNASQRHEERDAVAQKTKQRRRFGYHRLLSRFFATEKKTVKTPTSPVAGHGRRTFPTGTPTGKHTPGMHLRVAPSSSSASGAARQRRSSFPANTADDSSEITTDEDNEPPRRATATASSTQDVTTVARCGGAAAAAASARQMRRSASTVNLTTPTSVILHFFDTEHFRLFLRSYTVMANVKDEGTDEEGFPLSVDSHDYTDRRWINYVRWTHDPVNGMPFARVPIYLWHSFLPLSRFVMYSCDRGYVTVDRAGGPGHPVPIRFAVPDNEDTLSWRAARLLLMHEAVEPLRDGESRVGTFTEVDPTVTRFRDIFMCITESAVLFVNSFGETKAHFRFEDFTHIIHSAFHLPEEQPSGRDQLVNSLSRASSQTTGDADSNAIHLGLNSARGAASRRQSSATPKVSSSAAAALSFPFITFRVKPGDDEELEPSLLVTFTFLPMLRRHRGAEDVSLALRQDSCVGLLKQLLYEPLDYTWNEYRPLREELYRSSTHRRASQQQQAHAPTPVVAVTEDDIYRYFTLDDHEETGAATAAAAGKGAGRTPTRLPEEPPVIVRPSTTPSPMMMPAGRGVANGKPSPRGANQPHSLSESINDEVRVISSSSSPALRYNMPPGSARSAPPPMRPLAAADGGGDSPRYARGLPPTTADDPNDISDVNFTLRMARQPPPLFTEKDALFLTPLGTPTRHED